MYTLPRLLTPLLSVPGALWALSMRARNRLYDSGLLRAHRLPGPVISIGNLTLGGTGKTPLVIHVAQLVTQGGATPVLLSRGYGRQSAPRVLVVPPGVSLADAARQLGDEPALVRRHVPGIWLGISSDRFDAGMQIAGKLPDARFILDDGFQHRSLQRDLDLVVLDPTQPLERNRVFPGGSLREPVSALRRCDALVLNGLAGDKDVAAARRAAARASPQVMIFHCAQRIGSIAPFQDWRLKTGGTVTEPVSVFAIAAIGNPARFRRDVEALGIDVRGFRFFRDHYRLEASDWLLCWQEARAKGAKYVLTTEKDAIKIEGEPGLPLLVAVQSAGIVEGADFGELIRRAVTT